MTKHTPGPWRVQDCSHAYGDIEVILGDDFKIYIPLMATDWSPEKKLRMKASAHLLAAAPDLLAALKMYANQYDAPGEDTSPEYIAAQAAIAKAEP